jgi:hypothetical protein
MPCGHLAYMAPRIKHMSRGMFLNLSATWHLHYLGLHICHVAPRCRHMPCATFRPNPLLDLGHVAPKLGLNLRHLN